MFEDENLDYYKTLDVKPDASPSDIRQAYFRTKQAYSKDSAALYSLFDEAQTRQVLERIEEAFIVLSNPEKRREYDKVHGFLSPELPKFSNTFRSPKNSGTFSFSSESHSTNTEADQAMATKEDNLSTGTSKQNSNISIAFGSIGVETQKAVPSTNISILSLHEEGDGAWKANQNRLGIVRRSDLLSSKMGPAPSKENLDQITRIVSEEKDFSGEFLKRIREFYGVTLDELSDFTKISKNYLTALEGEDYPSLPAGVYTRGFVQQVSKALKIPTDRATSGYMSRFSKK